MKKILLDTNFLMVPFQLGINIFSEFDRVMQKPYQLITLKAVKDELEKIAKTGKGSDKSAAALGIQLARNIEVIDSDKKGDGAILDYAKATECIVATNDSELRKGLGKAKVQTIFVRNRSKLEIE
jgi:rRNA-processing protein FCF1